MKVTINIVNEKDKEEAVINCLKITNEINEAKNILENLTQVIPCVKDDETFSIEYKKIYYIESIDNKVFVYVKEDCYESKYKLYELEQKLEESYFLRCSKSMIVNIKKINSIKPDFNARFIATLLNGEKIVINRKYTKELKKRIGLLGDEQ